MDKNGRVTKTAVMLMCVILFILVVGYNTPRYNEDDEDQTGYWSEKLLCYSDADCQEYCYDEQRILDCYGDVPPICVEGYDVGVEETPEGYMDGNEAYCMPYSDMDGLVPYGSLEPNAGICRCRFLT